MKKHILLGVFIILGINSNIFCMQNKAKPKDKKPKETIIDINKISNKKLETKLLKQNDQTKETIPCTCSDALLITVALPIVTILTLYAFVSALLGYKG